MTALSKVRRAVLEGLVRKAETGPSLGFPHQAALTREQADADARRWARSWLAAPARAVLENDAGELHARDLEQYVR